MNTYEITFIVRPDLDDDQTRQVTEQVTGRVESAGGEIIAAYGWNPARRRMAYPIRDFGDGYYFTATFRHDPQTLRELENVLKLNERILRFLIVQASELAVRQSQQRAQQQATAAASPAPAPQPVATPDRAPAGETEPAAAEPVEAESVAAEAESAAVNEPMETAEETPAQPEPVSTAAAPAPSEEE